MTGRVSHRRRWLVPEVVQTSAMDCGPAVLKCLLAGYGIRIQYGRLREACQTDVDGTSIDTLEEMARRLGLQAEQVMVPPEHVLLPEANALPAILVVRLPDGATHFVLVWRRHGPLVQVMDPSLGRRWITCRQLIAEMYLHRQRVPAAAWREWAATEEMVNPLRRRLSDIGGGRQARAWIDAALASPDWQPIAQLDAVVRVVESLVRGGGLPRGGAAMRSVGSLLDQVRGNADAELFVPDRFWSVRPCPSAIGVDDAGEVLLWLRGAVLVRIGGRWIEPDHQRRDLGEDGGASDGGGVASRPPALGRELAAALHEPDIRPWWKIWSLVRAAGWGGTLFLLVCLGMVAMAVVVEGVLMRGMLDLRRDLAIVEQRLLAIGGISLFSAGLMLLEYRVGAGFFRLGRRLETALRVEFLRKIPRLHDRYFQSRPTSDMAERVHSLHRVRQVPRSAGQLLRATAAILLTAAAICWMEPASARMAFTAAALAITIPILFLPLLQGLDLRVRTHVGALTRFTFDALLGLVAVRAHVAHQAVSTEHESLLVDWVRASNRLLLWRVVVDGLQSAIGIGMAAGLLMTHASQTSDATGVLLLAYWALHIPALGEEIAFLVHQYPSYRNVTLRLLEPLGAPEEELPAQGDHAAGESRAAGDFAPGQTEEAVEAAAIHFANVQVRAGGHLILDSLNVEIPPQSHVAIVGPSGAGKSSLVGLLLGWHRAAAGQVMVDHQPLDEPRLARLRKETVWVDPAVHLWNRTLLDNLMYGNPEASLDAVGEVVQQADLYDVLQRLPDGLQSSLGESGGLVSGGEGQQVKLGRGFARHRPRLVILDEPFRGLERGQRREMLHRARQRWKTATLICITHDVGETLEFPRVLVLDGGRLVEDAPPATLAARRDSLYRSLLDAEESLRQGVWGSGIWRRIRLHAGRVQPDAGESASS